MVPIPDIETCDAYSAIERLAIVSPQDESNRGSLNMGPSDWNFVWGESDVIVGHSVAERLADVVPKLVPDLLENRQHLIEYLKSRLPPRGTRYELPSGPVMKIPFLLVDDGPSERLMQALEEARVSFGQDTANWQRYARWFELRLEGGRTS